MKLAAAVIIAGTLLSIGFCMESILKMIGITCLGEFTCDFCKDCGQEALGRQISMAARLTILGFSMPIVLAVLKNVSKLM